MENWYEVDNLRKMQDEKNRTYEEQDNRDNSSDFISYRMLYDGKSKEEAGISSHNLSSEVSVFIANKYMKNSKSI